jgi:hypothetical protein
VHPDKRRTLAERFPARLRCVDSDTPRSLDGAQVIKYAAITSTVVPTGATYHESAGSPIPTASALAIAKYDSDPPDSYYLFYLGSDSAVMIETWHESVDRALTQAAFEYEGLSWEDVSS